MLHLSPGDRLRHSRIMIKDNETPQGLDTLLDLNGVVIEKDKGCWIKFDVSKTAISK